MDSELARFLASGGYLTEESVVWGDRMPLHVTYYLGGEVPPLQYVTSVRAVVFQTNSVLAVRDGASHFHIVPGGRREGIETLEETLRREPPEETGWTVAGMYSLGFAHFHHLAPKQTEYAYPYPDFLWFLYIAEADNHVPDSRVPGEYELETGFVSIIEIRRAGLDPSQAMLLDAAIELRRSLGG